MAAELSGSSCKKKEKVNNQPEVAVVAMVTAAVVVWWQTAVRHHCSSMQLKMEVAAKSNQREMAAAVVHGGSAKWKWLKTRKKRFTINQRWQWQHLPSLQQCKMEVAEKQKLKRFTINQRWWWWQRWQWQWWHGGNTAMQHHHGSTKCKQLQNKKEKVNNQLGVVVMTKVAVVAW